MTIRFLAVHAPETALSFDNRKRIEQATGLEWVGAAGSADIFVTSKADCVVFADGSGIVVGHLFSRTAGFPRVTTPLAGPAGTDPGLKFSMLLKDFWGGYVTFGAATDRPEVRVLRDPSGTLPCYYHSSPGTIALASDVETLSLAGFASREVDWTYLGHHLFCQDLRSPKTALSAVKDLLPGFQIQISGMEVSTSVAWSPWDFVTPLSLQSDPSKRLEETIDQCVRAWAACFNHILAPASGGLDSSIVCASLAAQTTLWDCLNMATDEPEGDERYYARILAARWDKPLIEAFHHAGDVDIARSTSVHLPRPHGYPFVQSEEKITNEMVARLEIDAIFTGHGGDNVFCFLQSATPFLDRILTEGPGPGAWHTLCDICRLTGCGLYDVIAMAAGRFVQGSASYKWQGDVSYLASSDPASAPLIHPWLNAPQGALPGKAVHIAALLRIQGSLESASRFGPAPLIAPFLSQPIVELCLSIPTWKWCEGGVNRAVARRAFSSRLPAEVIGRRWKGGPNSYCLDVVARRRNELRAFLSDGMLAKHGVLDTASLDALFNQPGPIGPPDHLRLGALAEAEAWARHWHDISSQ